jgi:molybdopterin converting factor subunit 1
MMAKILYFGRLADTAQTSEAVIEVPEIGMDVEEFRAFAAEGNPTLREALALPTVRVAINAVLAMPGATVRNSDEVAFLPPVSGG